MSNFCVGLTKYATLISLYENTQNLKSRSHLLASSLVQYRCAESVVTKWYLYQD